MNNLERVSHEAEELLEDIINHEKDDDYFYNRFKSLSQKEQMICRAILSELKENRLVSVLSGCGEPVSVLITGYGYLYSKRIQKPVCDDPADLANFIKERLRTVIFETPTMEKQVQNGIECLLVGQGWSRGIDYDRESGKFMFSGKEYIPDFIIPKFKLCIEVKLLREGRKSKIIEEINADITAYSKEYKRQLFIVYDLGVIRDEIEFIRDIENSGEDIKVLIIKH